VEFSDALTEDGRASYLIGRVMATEPDGIADSNGRFGRWLNGCWLRRDDASHHRLIPATRTSKVPPSLCDSGLRDECTQA
jgi:hypothetical protein